MAPVSKRRMRTFLQFGIILLVLFCFALLYGITRGYTAVYFVKPAATVRVDGRAVRAYVHRSRRAMIITRRDIQPAHSYLIPDWEGSSGHLPVFHCGSWVAPRSPVLLINHENPVCSSLSFEESPLTTDSPTGPADVKGDHIEFRSVRGEVIWIAR